MTLYFPGPCEMRFFYTVDADPGGPLTHQMRFSFDPVSEPVPPDTIEDIDINLSGGGTESAATVVVDVYTLLAELLSADDATIDYVEIWKYTQGTFDASFVTSDLIGVPGENILPAIPAAQTIFTFRTRNGNTFKSTILDGTGVPAVPQTYAELNSINQDWVDYWQSASLSPARARDGSAPLAFHKMFNGQNEAIFKRRYNR